MVTSNVAGAGGVAIPPSTASGQGMSAGSAGTDTTTVTGTAGSNSNAGGATAPADAAAPGAASTDSGTPMPDAGPDAGLDATAPAADGSLPDPRFLVPATGPCPEFTDGYVMFAPDGVERRVLLYIGDEAATLDGPLIFSWHSTLPNPEDTSSWLGDDVIDEIERQGGVIAAPTTGHPDTRRPWDNTPLGASGTDGDQRLMDEIVACARDGVGIDLRRIHATGMSAGGLKTAQVSLRRSGYIASVVVYSGGLTEGDMPPDQDPKNPFSAMILYGGASDISPVDGIPYTDASLAYRDLVRARGSFAFLCDHGGGHSVPRDSQESAWRFMQDHPYGTSPSPYAAGLPEGFLRYCSLDDP
jgi:dienelactone hydrolase